MRIDHQVLFGQNSAFNILAASDHSVPRPSRECIRGISFCGYSMKVEVLEKVIYV